MTLPEGTTCAVCRARCVKDAKPLHVVSPLTEKLQFVCRTVATDQMGIVFKERFPKSEIITAEFVNYAKEVVALRQRLAAAAAAAKEKEGVVEGNARKTAEESSKDEADKQRARGVGTVVFNAVFGNLWDQRAALESAAAILEVMQVPPL